MAKKLSAKSAFPATQPRPTRAGIAAGPEARPIPELPLPRPVELSSLIGHKRATDVLRSAIASGRVHHGWIFSGPPGVGKFTAACAFAAELLTDKGDQQEHTRSALARQAHPDLHIVVKELAAVSRDADVRKSKQTTLAKEVLDQFLLEPALRSSVLRCESLASKVFIVDDADMVRADAQNSLLKLIEEPPLGTIIILVTTDEHRLLTTTRSRCQRVSFSPLDSTSMQGWLDSSGLTVEGPEREWLLAYCGGSPGQFQSAADGGLYEWHTKLDKGLTSLITGKHDGVNELGPLMASLVDARAKGVQEANEQASKEAANRAWGRRMLSFVAERLRRSMVGAARAGQPERSEWLASTLDAVASAERQLSSNVQLGLVFDNLIAQIASGRASPLVTRWQ